MFRSPRRGVSLTRCVSTETQKCLRRGMYSTRCVDIKMLRRPRRGVDLLGSRENVCLMKPPEMRQVFISLRWGVLCYRARQRDVSGAHIVYFTAVAVCDFSMFTANLPTKILDFRGFDSTRILILRGGIPMSIGNFLESLSQRILVGRFSVGRLGVLHCCSGLRFLFPHGRWRKHRTWLRGRCLKGVHLLYTSRFGGMLQPLQAAIRSRIVRNPGSRIAGTSCCLYEKFTRLAEISYAKVI